MDSSMFQSLLWWICHFDLERIQDRKLHYSFNPCYDGFVILTIWRPVLLVLCHSFNPCYDGFVILTKRIIDFCVIGYSVSILVMMDLSFWHPIQYELRRDVRGFNPCYDGFVILTLILFCIGAIRTGFNPCYDGFVILTHTKLHLALVYLLFQSLLWWICHFDTDANLEGTNLYSGFNPCYDGFVILTRQINSTDTGALWFQSLLWWICHFDLEIAHRSRVKAVYRFNPCYDGFVILTHSRRRSNGIGNLGFNPCYDGFVILTLIGILKSYR